MVTLDVLDTVRRRAPFQPETQACSVGPVLPVVRLARADNPCPGDNIYLTAQRTKWLASRECLALTLIGAAGPLAAAAPNLWSRYHSALG